MTRGGRNKGTSQERRIMTNHITARMEKKDVVKVTIILAVVIIIAIIAVIFGKGVIEVNEPTDTTTVVYNFPVDDGEDPFRNYGEKTVLTPENGEGWELVDASTEKQGKETLADQIDTDEYNQIVEASTPEVEVIEVETAEDAEEVPNDVIVKVENPNKHVHQYTDIVVAPTCTSKGYTQHVCECGHSYTDAENKASGHQYVSLVVASTTTSQGYTEHKCSVCGDVYKDSFVEALHSHSYTSHVVEATCENGGHTEHVCSCGDSYNDSYTEALGHNWGEAYCTRCNKANPNYQFPTEDTTAPESTGVDLGSGD